MCGSRWAECLYRLTPSQLTARRRAEGGGWEGEEEEEELTDRISHEQPGKVLQTLGILWGL